ncbi:hypothetical protein VTO42DRAFT_1612 [Malbranchea cinnamomea]
MLSESFVASFLTSKGQQQSSSILKDVGVCINEFQPSASAVGINFKNSSTEPNCLAVTNSHIFAAQTGKAVVHVYSRERGNQEATVPFPERIRSIAIAGEDEGPAILVLGTEGGRLILWETSTGRQVSTPASHLQPITSLVVDPTNNFILSGSEDANIHVWSLPDLLSFSSASLSAGQTVSPSNSPIRTFSNHTGPVTCIAVGHSISRNNIAISCSRDSTANVWEYRTGTPLRTYLLPSPAISLEVDPADRAVYVGYEDGSVQLIDFFKVPSIQNILHDPSQQATPSQLSSNDRWCPPSSDFGAARCLALSYDGTILLSGHNNGNVVRWDITKGRFASTVSNFNWPVTNLKMLPLTGLRRPSKRITVHNIVKPRIDHVLSNAPATGVVPATYTLQAHITSCSSLHSSAEVYPSTTSVMDEFSAALEHPTFPSSMISDGLLELTGMAAVPVSSVSSDAPADAPRIEALEQEIASLKKELSAQESARQEMTAEIIAARQRIAASEAYISDLLNTREQALNNEQHEKMRQWNLKRMQAFHDAESKGMNGDAALKKLEQTEYHKFWGTGKPTSGTDVEMDSDE